MNKTINRWMRSGMAMLLALVMIFSIPVVAFANEGTYCNAGEATSAVASAENYCGNARKIVDTIVSMLIDGEYADVFALAVKLNMKSTVVDVIVGELDGKEDLMAKIGMEPTAANKKILADEIYEVAKLYYNTNSKSGRAAADKAAMLEVLRFALVQMRGMSSSEAKTTAQLYYDLNSIKASKGQAAAEAHYLEKHGVKHSFAKGVCTKCGYEDPDYVAPSEPEDPKPTEPAPTEPKPEEPKPTEPKPEEPKPTEPKPQEPKPEEDKKPSFSSGDLKDFLKDVLGDLDDLGDMIGDNIGDLIPSLPSKPDQGNKPSLPSMPSSESLKELFDVLFGDLGDLGNLGGGNKPTPSLPGIGGSNNGDLDLGLGNLLDKLFGWLH